MEHFYQNIQGWFSFQTVYDLCIEKIPQNGVWVEVGSWKGKSISYAVVESINKQKNINFNVVDIWKVLPKDLHLSNSDSELYQTFLKNIQPIQKYVNIIKEDSVSASEKFDNCSVDVCMIDANHNYEFVIEDIKAWYPKLRPGGIMIGDDYSKKFSGVKKAIDEFTIQNNLSYDVISRCWIISI
jgi:hypothetical protein